MCICCWLLLELVRLSTQEFFGERRDGLGMEYVCLCVYVSSIKTILTHTQTQTRTRRRASAHHRRSAQGQRSGVWRRRVPSAGALRLPVTAHRGASECTREHSEPAAAHGLRIRRPEDHAHRGHRHVRAGQDGAAQGKRIPIIEPIWRRICSVFFCSLLLCSVLFFCVLFCSALLFCSSVLLCSFFFTNGLFSRRAGVGCSVRAEVHEQERDLGQPSGAEYYGREGMA
jgi:hypothetical protein